MTKFEDLESLRELWQRHNSHPDSDLDFYRLFASLRPELINPFVLVALEEGVPMGLLIGRLEKSSLPIRLGYFELCKIPVRQMNFLQQGFLGDPTPELLDAIFSKIISCLDQGVADLALLCSFNLDSRLASQAGIIPSFFQRDFARELTSHWRTVLPGSLDDFLKRSSKKHRYWLRRIMRVFEEDYKGKVEYKSLSHPQDLEQFIVDAEAIARSTYQRGLGVGFANSQENRKRLEMAATKGWLKAYLIRAEGKPLAFWCGRLYRNVMYLDWTGYDPSFRKYELGTVLFLKMVEDLCQSGVKELDYGAGVAFYKERFGDYSHQEVSLKIYAPTTRAILINMLKGAEAALNRLVKGAARRLKLIDRIKRIWRNKLSDASEEKEPTPKISPQ